MTTTELIAMLRKDAGICFEIRDAAQKEANTVNDVVAILGSRHRKNDELDRAAEKLKVSRGGLVAAWDKLVEFEKSKQV